MTELLPCPFCGSEGPVVVGKAIFFGFCGDCDTAGPWSPMRDRAVTGWNTRAPAAPVVVGEDCNVARVRAKLLDRSRVGLVKYGVTTERGDLSQADWLRHLQEELMYAAVYIEAALAGD